MDQIRQIAARILDEKYRGANVVLLAGSVVRGEGTAHSDLDLVVLFDELPAARRESYVYGGWPVEAFVHDPATLRYFIESVDGPAGVPSLAAMVAEGLEVPGPTSLSEAMKHFARGCLAQGPPAWSAAEVDRSRYDISDLLDDMGDPRSTAELYASAASLYDKLANHYLRAAGLWSARGKTIPRRLRQVSPEFAQGFERAFERLFREADTAPVIRLAHQVLETDGGRLFAGYNLQAPPHWRTADD